MASTSGTYRFLLTSVAPRSKRISEDTWEKHQAEICELYLTSLRLEAVMTAMQVKHGFQATQRQYIHQLGKWGVKKYNTSTIVGPSIPSDTSSPSTSSWPQGSALPSTESSKRRRSDGSIQSVSSSGPKVALPPKKRRDLGFLPDELLVELGPTLEPGADVATVKPPELSADASHSADWSSQTFDTVVEEPLGLTRLDMTATIPPIALTSVTAASDITSTSREESSLDVDLQAVTCAPPIVRTIDRDQPVDTLSEQDIAILKRAADYLAIFCYNQEAFELYILALKHHNQSGTEDSNFWYLVVHCVHTATKPEHVEIVQNIIRKVLKPFDLIRFLAEANFLSHNAAYDPSSGAHEFLLHMLLAFTYSRNAAIGDTEKHISLARSRKGTGAMTFFFCQDLLIYRNVLRGFSKCDLTSPTTFTFTPPSRQPSAEELENENTILHAVPGPFEVEPVSFSMGNPCVRSCLNWCKLRLQGDISLPIPFKRIEPLLGDQDAVFWIESHTFFVTMWEQSCGLLYPRMETWMTDTKCKMGISPTELLLLVCCVIYRLAPREWNLNKSEDNLIHRLRDGASRLLGLPGIELARKILKEYVLRNTVTIWPKWRTDVGQVEREHIFSSLEKALSVRFLGLGVTSCNPVNSMPFSLDVPQFQDEIVAQSLKGRLAATLASSLSSVDLSIFRSTRARAEHQLRNLGRTPSISASGTSSRASQIYRLSIAGISDLSTSLRSMSLSSGSQNGYSSRGLSRWSNLPVNETVDDQGSESVP